MKSVVNSMKTENFIKIRIGIGSPIENQSLVDYVIGTMPLEDRKILNGSIEIAAEAILEIINNGIDKAMNKFN